jgi:competence protein ComEA
VPFGVSRPTAIAAASLTLAVLVVVGHRVARTGAASAPAVAAPLEPVRSSRPQAIVVVHVVGAVRRPGLYRLRQGMRVADAVSHAGGPTLRANLAGLNLAAPVVDGTQILVPASIESPTGTPSGDGQGAVGGAPAAAGGAMSVPTAKVSLSSATLEQLDALPGVGPITAQKIVDYRAAHGPFSSVDDLDQVPGIGPTRIEQLRDLVTP